MRDIKFRAWDKVARKMHSFDDLHELDCQGDVNFHTLIKGLYANWTPLQYTGLKDKDGCEIYENDILACPDGINRVVEYCTGETSYKARHMPDEPYCEPMYLDDGAFKVLGNIHEHPHLLKEE